MTDAPNRGAGALHDLHGAARRAVVGHHEGSLGERVSAVVTLRRALARGRLPPLHELPWPSPDLRAGLFEVFERAQAAKLCHGRPKVTRSVVEWALEALDGAVRVQANAEVALAGESSPSSPQTTREEAASLALSMMTAAGHRRWAHAEELRQLCNCLSGTADEAAPGASARRRRRTPGPPGPLRSDALLARVVRADPSFVRELLPCVQTVAKRMEELGRHPVLTPREVTDDGRVAPLEKPSQRVETQGIEHGAELSRMLPSEAALLAHPLLRGYWHARRAERALLLYAVEGVARDEVPTRGEDDSPEPRGPLIVLLDTSSSMAGAPANLAKAMLLHLAMVCDVERRRLLLIEFSGPDDLLEVELGFDGVGLERLWEVLSHRFCGSTTPDPAVEHLVRRLDEHAWRGADVVFVSDGYFAVTDALANRIVRSRLAYGTRWVGVATATGPGWEDLGLDELHALRAQ